MAEVVCPECGHFDFYIVRLYKGSETWDVRSVVQGDEGFVVDTEPGPDSDEYDSIEVTTLYCNTCNKEVTELDEENVNYG